MRQQLEDALCRLASLAFQEKYIVHGTHENYALPDEIVESAISITTAALDSQATGDLLSQEERTMLSSFLNKVDQLVEQIPFDDPSVSNYELVHNSSSWLEIQQNAQELLKLMGLDLRDWEGRNV